jgi:TonB family protein
MTPMVLTEKSEGVALYVMSPLVAIPAYRWSRDWPLHATQFQTFVAVALILHVLPVFIALSGDGNIGSRPDLLDGVAVELIDARDFDRRRAAGAGVDLTASPPIDNPPPTPSPTPPAPDTPPLAPQQPAPPKAGQQQDFASVLSTPLESTFTAPPKQQKSLDLAPPPMKAWTAPPKSNTPQMSDLERYIERRNRPARARGGEVDAFTTAVAASVERVKPISNGLVGQVRIEFVVSETGTMQGLHVTLSSGQPKLDDLILRAVARAALIPPPQGATLRDRTFEITYTYR